MSNEEIAVKLEGHEHEIGSLKHRMEDQEEQAKILNDLVVSVKELALNMKNMISEQQALNNRLSRLENEPAEKWRTVTKTAVTAVVSAVFGALAMAAITLLTTGGF